MAVSADRESLFHTVALTISKVSLGESEFCRFGSLAMADLGSWRPLLRAGLKGRIDNLRLVEC